MYCIMNKYYKKQLEYLRNFTQILHTVLQASHNSQTPPNPFKITSSAI